MSRSSLLAATVAALALPHAVSAQDVEMLGRRYGTTPPAAYYEELARNPDAFRFAHGRAARMRAAATLRATRRGGAGPAGAGAGGPAGVDLGPRQNPVVGDVYVPVVLGLFDDPPMSPPVTQTDVQNGYFGGQPGSVAHFYAEVSNDSIALIGQVQAWVTSSMTQAEATQGTSGSAISGLGCCGIGDYIRSVLDLQAGVDWGAYDNDGPDGVPNSEDDDGYVDALAVIHPTVGAECDGNENSDRIWSHKWTLSDASTAGAYYQTSTTSNAPGVAFIRVDDYFVQGALSCDVPGALNEIGVFSHELGHAFGLPDLYDTQSVGGVHDGAGRWDLMATGTWGCSGTAPYSPCHMSAWSKAALGWVTVDTLPAGMDHGTLALPPVETSGVVYRVDAQNGSDEYYLLENRQSLAAATYDQQLPSEGLFVWQVDQGVVDARWADNWVNAFDHMGVWLRQADGLDELRLSAGERGDPGDPFPGSTANTAFHAATNPAARTWEGAATGLSILDIALSGDDVTFHLLTQFASIPDLVVSLTATLSEPFQLMATQGTPPFSWTVVAGTPPTGVVVQPDGLVTGAALELGLFPLAVEATDAFGLTATATLTLDVDAPSIAIGQLGSSFLLGGPALDSIQQLFLDRQGNDNGTYDLGDFRAWVLADPDLPLSAVVLPPGRRGGGS
jgi:M6 family metalloprotease-like protein